MPPSDRRTFIAMAGIGAVGAALPPPATPALPRPVAAGKRVAINPRRFGARGDGTTKDTAALQQALDLAARRGGEVVLAGGTFLTGALRIGTNTSLRIEEGATLLGSPDLLDYPVQLVRWEGRWIRGYSALLWASDAHDVALAGRGRIEASQAIQGRVGADGLRHPALLEFVNVRGLSVADLDTRQNGMWSIHPVYCDDAVFRNLRVAGGADGIDVDSCRRVLIEGCDFDTVDDCISLKSGRGMEGLTIGRATQDVTIRDCTFRDRRWACIGIGSETSGGIARVLVDRCRCLAAHTFAIYLKSRPGRGAFVTDVTMRDLDVLGAGYGFLRLNFLDSGRQDEFPVPGPDGVPTLRNFTFERIRVTDVPILVEAMGIHPDKPLDGFTLRDITGTCGHGITLANMRNVELAGIGVDVFSGPKVAVANVQGAGLAGAVGLIPPDRPADLRPPARPFRLGAVVRPTA